MPFGLQTIGIAIVCTTCSFEDKSRNFVKQHKISSNFNYENCPER